MKTKKVKSLFATILICLISSNFSASYAQQSGAVKHEKSLLWKISGNGLETPSYLFGTVHIIDSAIYFLDDSVLEKFNNCEKIVFEVDKSDPLFQQKTLSVLMLKNDSLDNLLSKEDYERVKAFFEEKLSIQLDQVKKVKPFYLTSFVASLNLPKKVKSYEDEFIQIAKNQNKEILGVSTVEKESEILVDRIPLEIQAQMLLDAIDDVEKIADVRDKLIQSYIECDIDRFYEITNSENKYEIVNESMFQKRHEVWIPNMIQLMNEFPCFFALGVAHLSGEKGLIESFRASGYEVKAIITR